MKERGSVLILALIVVISISAVVGGTYYLTNNPKIKFPTQKVMVPKPTVTAAPVQHSPIISESPPVDNRIGRFVEEANFPDSQGVNIYINIPEKSLKIFKVSYGSPQDCPAGCFYSNATGIDYKNKIGWISINNYGRTHISKLKMYDFDASDEYLFSDEFFQLLKTKDEWVYQNAFLLELAKDKDVPRSVLLKIANGLSAYIQPSLASSLLKNPTVLNDREVLTVIANLPVFSGDAYSEVRTKAQSLLK